MKAGPKGQITAPPLDLRRLPKRGGSRAVAFIERYVTVPKATGARRRLRLRPWQRQIVHGLLDEPRPRQGLVSIPAGNGTSTLAAALGLYGCCPTGPRAPRSSASPPTSGRPGSSSTPPAAW
jgi:phage terminase large subunit-like protein